MKGYFWRIFGGGWADTKTGPLWYSDIPNHVTRMRTDIQLSFQFSKKYCTLFHIITHLTFSLIRKLNFDSCWCFDIFYHPTFFIHQNIRTGVTYMLVQFKLKHLVFNRLRNGWRGRIHFFTFYDLNETFICPNLAWKLAHKWSMNWWSKEGKDTIFYIISQKDQKFKRKLTFDILGFFETNRSVDA